MWIVLWERPQCVPANRIAGYQSRGGGGERERKKKEVYSYKLPNGNFSHTLPVWEKCLGCLMAALFTAQQAPGFPSYMSFSSLHCDVWNWQEEKEAGFDTSPPPKASRWTFVGSFVDSQELWKSKFVLYLPPVMGGLRGKMDIRIYLLLLWYCGKKKNRLEEQRLENFRGQWWRRNKS